MVAVAAFVLWTILILAIGGCMVLLVSLVWLSYRERSTLAGQGYCARTRPLQPAQRAGTVRAPIGDRSYSTQAVGVGPAGRGRRQAA
jgi:hypothetical protein